MTTQPSESDSAAVESITDPESLRDRADVPFHEETDLVDEETLDVVADLDDVAVVGVTNESGEVLLRRLTEDCAWKLPVVPVPSGDNYADVARRTVEENTGLAVGIDALEAVWCYEARLENGDETATRYFVVFSASPASDGSDADHPAASLPEEDRPAGVGWFEELRDDAAEAPGTGLFFD